MVLFFSTHSRSSVNLVSGQDVFLIVEMRVPHYNNVEETVIAKRVGGEWSDETKFKYAPWKTNESYNVTIVTDESNSAFEVRLLSVTRMRHGAVRHLCLVW